MKKKLMALTFMSLAMACSVHAEDHSATVDIHANLTNNLDKCFFEMDTTIMNLRGALNELPDEGYNARTPTKMQYHLSNSCDPTKVALKIHGIPGSTSGQVLVNNDESESAAKGIGVGVFNSALEPISVDGIISIPPTYEARYINLEMVKLKNDIAVSGTLSSSLTIDIVHL